MCLKTWHKSNDYLKSLNYQYEQKYNFLKEKTDYLIYHLNKVIQKLPEFIKTIVVHLFNHSSLDLKYFKQQYDPEVLEKNRKVREKKEKNRILNLFNKNKEFKYNEEYELEKKNDDFEL